MMMRGTLDDLAAFAVVARTRSFTRAAAELRLSTSALSHLIKGLEARLDVRLLQRNSRSVAATAAGAQLLRALEPALVEIGGALEQLGQDRGALSGTVRITATRHAYETVIRPVLPAFHAAHRQAKVEVLIDTQFRDIIADRLDAGIRLGEKLDKDMIAVSVGLDLRMAVVASPGYLARHTAPAMPQDLTQHDCINYRITPASPIMAWDFEADGRTLEIKVDGPLTFNAPELMLGAAMDGLGIAYVLADQAAPDLAAGRLVRLLEEWTPPFAGYFLYYPSRKQVPPTLAAFIAALRAARPRHAGGARHDAGPPPS
jgi:DNA-binding transcriptional LysR family regulator